MEWLLGLPSCDSSLRTAKGETGLHLAAARGDEAVCQTLLKGGCPAEAVTRGARTALHVAARMGERICKLDCYDGRVRPVSVFKRSCTTDRKASFRSDDAG